MVQTPKREQYFEILSNIKYAGDIERVVVVKLVERSLKVFWPDLPDPHEDELMIGMTSKEHCKELVGILRTDVIPCWFLRQMR
jgi:hypothetical protein